MLVLWNNSSTKIIVLFHHQWDLNITFLLCHLSIKINLNQIVQFCWIIETWLLLVSCKMMLILCWMLWRFKKHHWKVMLILVGWRLKFNKLRRLLSCHLLILKCMKIWVFSHQKVSFFMVSRVLVRLFWPKLLQVKHQQLS